MFVENVEPVCLFTKLFSCYKTTKRQRKQIKHGFFAENINFLPDKQLSLNFPFQSTKFRKKKLCADNKVQETIEDVYCPTCRNKKCFYISTKKTTNFYDFKKCKACCHVLNIPFKDQKPTIMFFGSDGTNCFVRKTSRGYEKEKPSKFWKKVLCLSQPSTSEPEPKKVEVIQYMA